MRKKLIILNSIVVSFALLLMFSIGAFFNRQAVYDQAKTNIISLTEICAANYQEDMLKITIEDDNIRETIIDSNGVVLLDSKEVDVSKLENHLEREEIQNALKGNPSVVIHYSDTLNINMMYYALKVDTKTSYIFVRVAMSISNIDAYVLNYFPIFITISLIILAISLVIVYYIEHLVLKPLKTIRKDLNDINNGIYSPGISTTRDDEIDKIILEINTINTKINHNLELQEEEKKQLDYVLNNVSDGIVVLDSAMNISLINENAKKIFNLKEVIGKNYLFLTKDEGLLKEIQKTRQTKTQNEYIFSCLEKYFLASIILTSDEIIIIAISNITYEKNEEKMREEFFSNASHELKTPLTSIKGFNELIALNNKDDKIQKYTAMISSESTRMLNLIDDMLYLSKIETSKNVEKETCDVKKITEEVFDSLDIIAKNKTISLQIVGELSLEAGKNDLYRLIRNLVENSIKYSNNNSYVIVHLFTDKNNKIIEVSDNGFGIPKKDQSRIFERFYRVDDSRSRDCGGTGLGLSIVKHIAILYKANISLISKEDVGTSVIVSFSL